MDELFEKGAYVAQYGENGPLVAMDEYIIERIPNGFKIKSDNTMFGQHGFRQCAEMTVDAQWLMQDLRVIVDDMHIELNVRIDNGSVNLTQKQGQTEETKVLPLQQLNQYFFIYSGALVIPFIWLRGFNFKVFEKVQYQLLPVGLVEVMQIKQTNESDILQFSLNIQVGEMTDFVNIKTDNKGKVLQYESALSKLIIKPQPLC